MRKYHQAALALTAVFSLIALMFYRHEYNKLRFVLEVFNYFEKPVRNGFDDNCTASAPISPRFNKDFLEPSSTWQRLSDNFYVYSAYRISEDEIRAIAFGENTDILDYSCKIYFDEDDGSVQQHSGDFAYSLIENSHPRVAADIHEGDKTFSGFVLSCKTRSKIHNDKQVVGVEFLGNDRGNKGDPEESAFIKVHTIVENTNKSAKAICVAPFDTLATLSTLRRMDMISFLAFHDNLGLDNFVIYDSGISHVFNNGLKGMSSLQTSQYNFTYVTIPWNFPYKKIQKSIIRDIFETDCLYRTYNKAALSISLAWDEYVNLRYHSSLVNVLSDYNKITGVTGDKFELKTVTFCTDQASQDSFNNSTPIILRATRRLRTNSNNEKRYIYRLDNNIINISKGIFMTQENMNDLVVINKYEKCSVEDRREIVENGILRFAETMPSAQIFQYFITGKLFD